jgi:hypothetical protein
MTVAGSLYVRGCDSTPNIAGTETGGGMTLARIDGKPAIAYTYNNSLKFVIATDADGRSWGTPVILATSNLIGQNASLVEVAGKPAIACGDGNTGDLDYFRADDATGTSWQPKQVLATTPSVVEPCLAVIDGKPTISFHGAGGDMEIIQANDSAGSSWPATWLELETADSCGYWSTLTTIGGQPAVCYFDLTTSQLKFSTDPGSGWITPVVVSSTFTVEELPTAMLDVGGEAQIYFAINYSAITTLASVRGGGAVWDSVVIMDAGTSPSGAGSRIRAQIVNGKPQVAYARHNPTYLVVAKSIDPEGLQWQNPEPLFSILNNATVGGLLDINGRTAVAYSSAPTCITFTRQY